MKNLNMDLGGIWYSPRLSPDLLSKFYNSFNAARKEALSSYDDLYTIFSPVCCVVSNLYTFKGHISSNHLEYDAKCRKWLLQA